MNHKKASKKVGRRKDTTSSDEYITLRAAHGQKKKPADINRYVFKADESDSASSETQEDSVQSSPEIVPKPPVSDSDYESESEDEAAVSSDNADFRESAPNIVAYAPKPYNSNKIFKELIKRQLPNVPSQWKLNINDMKRICKYIETSIFGDNCCVWTGYITNMNNSNKGTYVNFYFRNKKVALHRLLYSNFVAPLDNSEYLKFSCDNKGICCNVNHYEKYKYSKNTNAVIRRENPIRTARKEIKIISAANVDSDSDDLTLDFN